jgi:hypothetical protein
VYGPARAYLNYIGANLQISEEVDYIRQPYTFIKNTIISMQLTKDP